MHGNRPRGTKLRHGKLKTIRSKDASREEEEEGFNLAGTQLNEALASEERLRKREQSCMAPRVVVLAIFWKVQTRSVQERERAKVKDKARTETVTAEQQDNRRPRRRVKLERGHTSRCLHQQDHA